MALHAEHDFVVNTAPGDLLTAHNLAFHRTSGNSNDLKQIETKLDILKQVVCCLSLSALRGYKQGISHVLIFDILAYL